MLELVNNSYFIGNLYTGFDQKNQSQLTCVIKASYRFTPQGKLKLQRGICIEETDQYYGDPAGSSLKIANEITPYKQGSEILLYGTAQSTHEKSTAVEVGIKIVWPDRIWEKQLRIFGPRKWQSILMGYIPGKPEILQPLVLRYEYAFGGQDQRGRKKFYELNPVGQGFTESSGYKDLALPQIENVLINTIKDRPIPAGFGPIPTTWKLTKKNNKEQSISTSVAPADQCFTNTFKGDEKIHLKNLVRSSPNNICSLTLPKIKPTLDLYLNEKMQPLELLCDRVVINTDLMNLNMIWRIGIPWQTEDEREGVILLR